MNKTNPTYLEKTIRLMSNQEDIIRQFSGNCTEQTLIETIKFNNTEIKHFKLADNTHVYSTKGEEPKRLISSVELPNITYFTDHWNPMLLPDSNLSNINGSFIFVNQNSISYSSFFNGNTLFNAGYTFKINYPKRTQFFYEFNEYDKDGLLITNSGRKLMNEVPPNVYSVLGLIKEKVRRRGINNLGITNGIETLNNLESSLQPNKALTTNSRDEQTK